MLTIASLDNCCEIREELKKVKKLVTPRLSFNASYACIGGHCPNEHQRKFLAKTYPIYREIYHFFAVERGHDNVYASPTLTCEEGGMTIRIENVKDIPLLNDLMKGKAMIVDKDWLENRQKKMIEKACDWIYNNQPSIGDSMRQHVDKFRKTMEEL